jgi:hypothetical protein
MDCGLAGEARCVRHHQLFRRLEKPTDSRNALVFFQASPSSHENQKFDDFVARQDQINGWRQEILAQ